MSEVLNFENIENFVFALNWKNVTSFTILDEDLLQDKEYFQVAISDLNFKNISNIKIFYEESVSYSFENPVLKIKLVNNQIIRLFYCKDFGFLRLMKVMTRFLLNYFRSKIISGYNVFLISSHGSIYRFDWRRNVNLPQMAHEPFWVKLKRIIRSMLASYREFLSIKGYLVVS